MTNLMNLVPSNTMIHMQNGYSAYYSPEDHEFTIYRHDQAGLVVVDRIGTGIEFDETKGWLDVEPRFEVLARYYDL